MWLLWNVDSGGDGGAKLVGDLGKGDVVNSLYQIELGEDKGCVWPAWEETRDFSAREAIGSRGEDGPFNKGLAALLWLI